MTFSGKRSRAAIVLAGTVLAACGPAVAPGPATTDEPAFDTVLRGGTIIDGSGAEPFSGDVAIRDGRIAFVGRMAPGRGRNEFAAGGFVIAPGFINLLSWAGVPLLVDGRAQSDLRQGVTTEVMGEGVSLGPLTEVVRDEYYRQQSQLGYELPWSSLGEALEHLERRGVAVNVASYVGAATVRANVLGFDDITPSAPEIGRMQELVSTAMEEGALGVASSLIYAPGAYANTDELVALAEAAARCGGIYATHLRSETDRFVEAVDEAIDIGRRSGAPVEIFHLKAGGMRNWGKLDEAIARIETARDSGLRVTSDMYAYAASSTGLTASIPPWAQAGELAAWLDRLRDPAVRKRILADMRDPDADWDNIMQAAGGGDGVLLVGFRNPDLRQYVGRTVAEVAAMRNVTEEEAVIDLVVEDGSRVSAIYFTMSEDNLAKKLRLPWMSVASDGRAVSAEGEFLEQSEHPRSYGNFARVLGEFVRERRVLSLHEAVYRMTGLPARVLALRDRGVLREGLAADIVVFDAATIADRATFENPYQYATGVRRVYVNGKLALDDGVLSGRMAGQVVRGRGWRGWPDGGCRATANDWSITP